MGLTIDITETVEYLKSSWVTWAKAYLFGVIVAIPALGWLAAPVIKLFFGAALDWILNKLANSAEQQAFFMNTVLRKASQASDYTDVMRRKLNFPLDGSDKDYEELEREEMVAFGQLVRVTA